MKPKIFIFALLLILSGQQLLAQCGTCIGDPACVTLLPDGGICPEIMPDATAGNPYSEVASFHMPEMIQVTSPLVSDVRLDKIVIVDMIGAPAGLDFECSTPDCTYYPCLLYTSPSPRDS